MKSKEEILKQYANDHSYETWWEFMYDSHEHTQIEAACEVMELYAKQQPAPSPIPGEEVEAFKEELIQENQRLLKEIVTMNRLLEDLTPGGSEFVNDPQRCAEFIRDQQKSIAKVIKPLKFEIASLKEALEKLDASVKNIDNYYDLVEQVQIATSALQFDKTKNTVE